jgi:cytochrome c553
MLRPDLERCPYGQRREPTSQLDAFRVDERMNDSDRAMRTLAKRLSDVDTKAQCEYYAGMRSRDKSARRSFCPTCDASDTWQPRARLESG